MKFSTRLKGGAKLRRLLQIVIGRRR